MHAGKGAFRRRAIWLRRRLDVELSPAMKDCEMMGAQESHARMHERSTKGDVQWSS